MSIHKTKAGTYQVRWRVDGRLKAKNFDRKIDADKFEASLIVESDKKHELVSDSQNPMTFSDYADLWFKDYGIVHKAEGTLVHDRQIVRDYFKPMWDKLPLASIRRRDIAHLQGKLIRE